MLTKVIEEAADKIIRDIEDRRGLKQAWHDIEDDIRAEIRQEWANIIRMTPVNMLLFCPNCAKQHIDKAEPGLCQECGHPDIAHVKGELICIVGKKCPCTGFQAWLNPPHKSHRCNWCNHVWRPSDSPTNGVLKLQTKGVNDQSITPVDPIREAATALVEVVDAIPKRLPLMEFNDSAFIKNLADKATALKMLLEGKS